MENEVFVPCKSCGTMLNGSAASCPHCGDVTPFCYDPENLRERGKKDGIKITWMARIIVIIAIFVSLLLFPLTHIWWLCIVVFVVVMMVFALCATYISAKMEDNMDKRLGLNMDVDYRFYKNTFHYDLNDNQYREWKRRAFQVYEKERSKHTK